MDQPLVVKMYYQTPGNIEVTIFLKKETGRSETPDMNADIITQFHGENRTAESGGILVSSVSGRCPRIESYATRFLFTRFAASCTRPQKLRRPINTHN